MSTTLTAAQEAAQEATTKANARTAPAADRVLTVEDLQTHFIQGDRAVKSVDGVSFSLRR